MAALGHDGGAGGERSRGHGDRCALQQHASCAKDPSAGGDLGDPLDRGSGGAARAECPREQRRWRDCGGGGAHSGASAVDQAADGGAADPEGSRGLLVALAVDRRQENGLALHARKGGHS